jgi:antirestriction protein ArdC
MDGAFVFRRLETLSEAASLRICFSSVKSEIACLKKDKRTIFTAAAYAQHTVDFLHGAPETAKVPVAAARHGKARHPLCLSPRFQLV